MWMFLHSGHFQVIVCRSQLRLVLSPRTSADGIDHYYVLPDGEHSRRHACHGMLGHIIFVGDQKVCRSAYAEMGSLV